ncbi:MAG: hypothetical protein QW734_04480 [Candidatus Bathyarchaeia archaeon]
MCAKYYFIPIKYIISERKFTDLVKIKPKILGAVEFSEEEIRKKAPKYDNKEPQGFRSWKLDDLEDLLLNTLSTEEYEVFKMMLWEADFVLKTYDLPPEKLDEETIQKYKPPLSGLDIAFVTSIPISFFYRDSDQDPESESS